MKLPPLLDHASQSAAAFAQEDDEMKPLAREFKTFMENLEFILDNSDPTYAYQLKTTEEDVVFEAIPIEVAGFLSDALFKKEKTIVLTSATMAVNKSLDYFKRRLGVSVYAEPLIFQSPFDYKSNTILYLPTHLPFPNVLGENFDELAVAELENILNVTRGRALILFTSFHQMNEFYNALAPKVKYKIYKQGMTYSRSQLLERFIKEESSVLMAVKSFWQGIDVPGPSLSAVIIVKLPFPVKTHPMTEAKEDYIRARNGDPFYDFYIPEATILLKQAIGRLLRNKNDKGLIAILDSRISFKPYGPKILSNLPPSPRCFKLEAVKDFFTKNGV
jgi:ATP-dependent DNA helicase DinG